MDTCIWNHDSDTLNIKDYNLEVKTEVAMAAGEIGKYYTGDG